MSKKGILRPIIPRNPLYRTQDFQSAIRDALEKTGKQIVKTFEGTTSTWKTKVDFDLKVTVNGTEASIEVSTKNEIYGYVNEGTKPHIIRPKRVSRLRFQTGYKAKTKPRSITSGSGGAFGPWVSAKVVHHPGTKAREFTKWVMVRYQDVLPVVIQDAISRAARER